MFCVVLIGSRGSPGTPGTPGQPGIPGKIIVYP